MSVFCEKEYIDYENFSKIRENVLCEKKIIINDDFSIEKPKKESFSSCIGEMSERVLHRTLKKYLEKDEDFHEVFIDGFFADIFKDGKVIEIQTKAFNKLRKKLTVFLKNYEVTIIFPIIANKTLVKLSKKDDKPISARRSPSHQDEYFAMNELYKIKEFLNNKNLNIHFYYVDAIEYKYEKKFRREIVKIESIPSGILKIFKIENVKDYLSFLPKDLKEKFTSKDLASSKKIKKEFASLYLNILSSLDLVKCVGKLGRYNLYEINVI